MPMHTISEQGHSFEFGCKQNDDGKWVLDQAWVNVTDPNYQGDVKKWSIVEDVKMNDEFDTQEEFREAFGKAADAWTEQNFAKA